MNRTVAELIAAERFANDRFLAALRAADSVAIGREPTQAEQDEENAAGEAQLEALDAVLKAEPRTGGELCAIVDLFLEREVDRHCVTATADQVHALMATVKRFAMTAPVSPTPALVAQVPA